MLKTFIFLVTGLALGLAAATFWPRSEPTQQVAGSMPPAGLGERISVLEASLNRETLRRAELESELRELADEFETLRATLAPSSASTRPDDAPTAIETAAEPAAEPPFFARRRGQREVGEALTEQLIESGFGADRAAWISQRTSELRMQALQAQYEAAREGERPDPRSLVTAGETLRSELGDTDYERYLEATGRPTSVRVGSVLVSSPAEQAGLMPGDEVVAYSGERVFSNMDLNRLMLEGSAGEPVTVDVVRDGQLLQVVIPRGPLGIAAGGGFRGR